MLVTSRACVSLLACMRDYGWHHCHRVLTTAITDYMRINPGLREDGGITATVCVLNTARTYICASLLVLAKTVTSLPPYVCMLVTSIIGYYAYRPWDATVCVLPLEPSTRVAPVVLEKTRSHCRATVWSTPREPGTYAYRPWSSLRR